jgi:hypothetical protein
VHTKQYRHNNPILAWWIAPNLARHKKPLIPIGIQMSNSRKIMAQKYINATIYILQVFIKYYANLFLRGVLYIREGSTRQKDSIIENTT